MDALTAFDRASGRARRPAAVERVPLLKRTWFRVVAFAVVAAWLVACVGVAVQLAG